jgi:hypothetical protein
MESLQENDWELRAGDDAEEMQEFEAAAGEPPPRFVDYGLDI